MRFVAFYVDSVFKFVDLMRNDSYADPKNRSVAC